MFSLHLPIPAAANMSFSSHKAAPVLAKPCHSLPTCRSSCKTNSSLLRVGRQKCAISEIEHEINLTEEMDLEAMPKHVAVILDGNRRWAKSKGLPVTDGHKAGAGKALDNLFRNCLKYGVKVLTVFTFSTENWVRPQDEIHFLMDLFEENLVHKFEKLAKHEVRLSIIGNRVQFPKTLQKQISDVEERTKQNKKMHFIMAMSYSGRSDITEATRKIATKVKHGVLQVEDVDDNVFEQHLGTNVIDEFPNPDLMIRSSGELRISNFMLWQLAYTEMFFMKKLWPEFDDTDFVEAVTAFQRRQRRFGGHRY